MKCTFCNSIKTKVIDKRNINNERVSRRRRECVKCKKRFTTYERTEGTNIIVIKKDGSKEEFSPKKLKNGILKACEKRPISNEKIEEIVNYVSNKVKNYKKNEVKSKKIGELVIKKLKKIDNIAYVRFASVYKSFDNAKDFEKELKELK